MELFGWLLYPQPAILCALAWHRASVVTDIFYRLALSPGELAYDSERRSGGFWRMAHLPERVLVSRADLVEQYVTQWLVGGVFLALFAAATRVRISGGLSINVLSMGIPPQMAVAVVLYFLIGLVLLSQARLAVLRAQWLMDGVEMPERLPTRWGRCQHVGHRQYRRHCCAAAAGLHLADRRDRQRVVMFFVRMRSLSSF
jgi:hypothetical protein